MSETKREGYIRRIENALKNDVAGVTHDVIFTEKATMEILELLKEPSAETKTGKWINIDTKLFRGQCSACREWSDVVGNYCPWCGVDMRGEQNE